ncbi:MAG TPA: DoxX family protein [Opitutaceae bacterium]|nr:DoxX family protein [Opitutaceae bacterium]
MNLASSYAKLDRLLATLGGWLQPLLLLVIRVWWGWSFFQTGKGKLMNLEGTTEFFASLHIPAPKLNAIVAGSTECFGGLLLLAGLFSRPIAVPLIFTMLVAYWTNDHAALVAIFSDTDKFTGATPFLFLFACLIVFAFGPGPISLDALFFKKGAAKN